MVEGGALGRQPKNQGGIGVGGGGAKEKKSPNLSLEAQNIAQFFAVPLARPGELRGGGQIIFRGVQEVAISPSSKLGGGGARNPPLYRYDGIQPRCNFSGKDDERKSNMATARDFLAKEEEVRRVFGGGVHLSKEGDVGPTPRGKCIILADRETTLGFETQAVVAVGNEQYYDSAGRLAWSRATTVLVHVTDMKDTMSGRIRFQEAHWQYSAGANALKLTREDTASIENATGSVQEHYHEIASRHGVEW